ncbi:hypothetical protein [Isoptericola sp. NPDC055881]
MTTVLVAACGAPDDLGFGPLQVRALDPPALRKHFSEEPGPLTGELRALSNGCLVVTIDGVDHVVIWPDGTESVDAGVPVGRYEVTLPDERVLRADVRGGDRFTATGVVADSGGVVVVDLDHPDDDQVGSYLGYCGVDAPPVMFPDAATFVVD